VHHRALEDGPLGQVHLGRMKVDVPRDADQYLDEIGDRTSGGADIGHEQPGVARGLVDLDPEPVHQPFAFERRAVDAGQTDVDRHPRRIQRELVLLPGRNHIAEPGAQRLSNSGGSILFGDHFCRTQAVHVFAEQRMMINCVAQLHRVFKLPLHQLEALQRGLAPTKIKRSQNLVVG
jgi:hypothetical protein